MREYITAKPENTVREEITTKLECDKDNCKTRDSLGEDITTKPDNPLREEVNIKTDIPLREEVTTKPETHIGSNSACK